MNIVNSKKLLFILIIFLTVNTFGQTVTTWGWCKSATGTGIEEANAVATDNSGNVYITGIFSTGSLGFGSTMLSNLNPSNSDMFIAKYNSAGTLLWAKSFGNTGNEITTDIGVDPAGNVYLAGTFESDTLDFGNGNKLINSSVWLDYFVVKFNPSGNSIWARSAMGGSKDFAKSIAFDNNNNVYVAGFYESDTLIFNINTSTHDTARAIRKGVYDLFLVKYDQNGNYVNYFAAGGTDDDEAFGVATDNSGNIFITGYYMSTQIDFGTNTLYNTTNSNNSEMFIVKLNSSMSVIWAKSVQGEWFEYGNALVTDASGNVYVTGEYSSDEVRFGSFKLTNSVLGQNASEIYVVKYNSSGVAQWAKGARGEYSEYAKDITLDANGNIYVTGNFVSPTMTIDTKVLTNSATSSGEIYVIQFNTSGSFLTGLSASSTDDDDSRGIASYQSNAYIVGTYKANPKITFGSSSLTNSGGYDILLASLSTRVGIQETDFDKYFSVYPNPVTNDQVRLNFSNMMPSTLQISIYNSIGQKSYHQTFEVIGTGQTLDLPVQNKGMNIIEVIMPDGQHLTKRIISE